MYHREDISNMIAESQRVKRAIAEHQRPRTPEEEIMDFFTPKKGVHYFDGQDGKTPIKGKDYFTKEEVNEIVQFILKQATPVKGVHYFDGEDGKKGSKGDAGKDGQSVSKQEAKDIIRGLLTELPSLTEKDIKKMLNDYTPSKSLEKRLNSLQDAVMRNYGGHGGKSLGSAPKNFSISSLLNGSTKSFTIPSNIAITGVWGSSTPFIFEPTDYSGSGTTTLTFGAGIDAPSMLAAGQSIIVQYVG